MENEEWRSCCLRMNPQAAVFFSQLFISSIVILFCIYELNSSTDCDTRGFYSALLTLILGWFVPSPGVQQLQN